MDHADCNLEIKLDGVANTGLAGCEFTPAAACWT